LKLSLKSQFGTVPVPVPLKIFLWLSLATGTGIRHKWNNFYKNCRDPGSRTFFAEIILHFPHNPFLNCPYTGIYLPKLAHGNH
jgi:hypothetical protein